MALQSPGVQVTVIDESFYTPAEPGTTPLIVVATGQDKTNAAGTGTATATTKANAGKAFKLTSQRDLVDLFGVPFFEKTASSTPVHGSERNEYGLLAAYSLLGVSNAAFIVRADVDLNQLASQAEAPGANPTNGTWWVDTSATAWGIQEWNGAASSTTVGQRFTTKTPLVLTDADATKISGNAPKPSVGIDGDYAVVFETGANKEFAKLFYKRPNLTEDNAVKALVGGWVLVGSEDWAESHPAVSSSAIPSGMANGDDYKINGTTVSGSGTGDAFVISLAGDINTKLAIQGISARVINRRLYLYTKGRNDGDSTLSEALELQDGDTGVWEDLFIDEGTYHGPRLVQSPHTQVPSFKEDDAAPRPTGSVWIKTTEPNSGSKWSVKQWRSASETWETISAPLYSSTYAAEYYLDRSGGGSNILSGALFVQTNAEEYSGIPNEASGSATFRVWRRDVKGAATVTAATRTSALSTGIQTFTISESQAGSLTLNPITITTESLVGGPTTITADLDKIAQAINQAAYNETLGTGLKFVSASVVDNVFSLTHSAGGTIQITDTTGILGSLFSDGWNVVTDTGPTANWYESTDGADYDYLVTNWKPLATEGFTASASTPQNDPSDGQLWYNSNVGDVDMMVHNGTTWKGYREVYPQTDPAGPNVGASEPELQSDGTDLVNNDLWISTADLENYPTIYRYQFAGNVDQGWYLVDKTDQTSEEGVLFADARYGLSGETGDVAADIVDYYATTNASYLDPDAPDADLYPKGMLLWNLRRSGGNVKRYVNNFVANLGLDENVRFNNQGLEANGYYDAPDRWVTASPNNEDGSGSFLRKAQRSVIVAALKSAVDTSSEIRDEERRNFNLIAAPGYPELMSNLVNLNIDRGVTAFVVGDVPLRLAADATTLTNWGTNAELVTDNGDNGIVTYDEYLGVFYPSGFTTDLGGSNAVVPSSHMMLRTIALSDNVSYPWFAPAGTRRGGITNATAVGYIDGTSGEFQTVALNEGQRDTLYDLKINPITFFNGVGLINFGQKTRARNASALDRINVARLTVYLRSQLNKLARPYIFEPNDKITRDEVKQACESLLLELVGLRALYDFAVVCDESNNTPARIDRNELWVDIAIEPVKAVEFIYIPLRVKNTGEI
jgi:hypothetical protein